MLSNTSVLKTTDLERAEGPQASLAYVADQPHMTSMGHALLNALTNADDISALAPVFTGRKLVFKHGIKPGKTIDRTSEMTMLGERHRRRLAVAK